MSATSPSSRKMTRFVWARIAATSEARKFSSPSDADDERHVLARADEPVGSPRVHHRDRVRAVSWRSAARTASARSPAYASSTRCATASVSVSDVERVAARGEPVAQLPEVLDDPVVDDRDVARAVLVRMGVQVVRPAVGRPARVGEADAACGVRSPAPSAGWPACRRASRRTGRRPSSTSAMPAES